MLLGSEGRKDMRRKSDRESDITLKLECVKLAQRALPEAFSEIMFAFAQEIHAWVLAEDERPSRRASGERRATTSSRHPEARARPLRPGEPRRATARMLQQVGAVHPPISGLPEIGS
jgi:hypothetical protein